MKKVIATADAPAAVGPYSQAIEVDRMLYISGQLPIDPTSGIIPEGIGAQSEQSLRNLGAILHEAGYDYPDVVKCTVLLSDMEDFSDMNAVYARYFTMQMPARICFQAARLPRDVLVEIDAVAVK